MSIVIGKEKFTPQLFGEILPLAQKCWEESTIAKGASCAFYGEREFSIVPHVEEFYKLTGMGSMVVVTIRDAGRLVGYVEGFIYRSLHHKSIVGGIGDSIYIEPDYRAYAAIVIDKFETEMELLGASILGWPTTLDGHVYKLLKARGFVGDDIVMEKRLCASQLQ